MQDQLEKVVSKDQADDLLLEACQRDPNAFEKIFHKYHDPIFNYAVRRTCNVSLAQDITANTFLKALNHIGNFEWKGISLSSWLYRIATNEINLHYRKFKRQVPLTFELSETLIDEHTTDSALLEIEEAMIRNDKFKKACDAISRLKFKYQTVLTLRYFEDKSIREISEILEMSENTVKTHIRRGLIQLRKQLWLK